MTTFDTNVVIRFLVKDDEAQTRRAEAAWRSALADDGVFLPKVVVIETVWVLKAAYRFSASTVAQTLRLLFDVEGVELEDDVGVRRALVRFERGSADFSDYLILESAEEAGASPVKTFDRRFAREKGVELVTAVSLVTD